MPETRQIHFTGDIVSRNKGQSAVEHAAYRSGEKLYLDREGETFDYTRKRGVLYTEIMLADHAPVEWEDRQTLWNAVEDFEKKNDAQLARSLEFSLPFELTLEEDIKLCKEIAEYYRKQGMCVDFCIHAPDGGNKNIHCHMMHTVRPLTIDGTFIKHKSHREYILSDILDMVQAVDTARQVARRKELQKSAPVTSQLQHQEQDQPSKPKKGGDAR